MDPVTVCNIGLLAFGQEPIESTQFADPDNNSSQLCAAYFDPCARAVFEQIKPRFATGFIDLGARQDSKYGLLSSPVSLQPLVAAFVLPDTVINVLACDDGSGEFTILWEQEEQFVNCEDTDKLLARVVTYEPDTNKWTPNFRFAVAYHLASLICHPITHSTEETQRMEKMAAMFIKTSTNLDGLRGNVTPVLKMSTHSLRNRR